VGLDVLFDNLIRHITCAYSEVTTCPQMSSPELAIQFSELLQHTSAAAPFQALNQLADRQAGRNRDQQVNVIRRHMTADDIHIQRHTRLPDQLSQPKCNLSPQHRLAILGDPHYMVFQIVNRVCCLSIAHCPVRIDWLQHGHDHNVRAAAPPPQYRTAQPARTGVKTACLKAGVSDPIYRQ